LFLELIKPILKATPTPMPSPISTGEAAGVSILGVLGLIAIFAYFIPALIAAIRQRQTLAIFVLNLFLGWTFVGWVVALVWACTGKD
jgi:hypothetical protein